MRRLRAAAWVRERACRHDAACRHGAARLRGAASQDRAAAPPGAACGRAVAGRAAAGRREHTAAGTPDPGSCRAGNQDAVAELRPGREGPEAAVRHSAGSPGRPVLPASRARDRPWARRAGRLVSRRWSGSARKADRNVTRGRCPAPGHLRGTGPAAVPDRWTGVPPPVLRRGHRGPGPSRGTDPGDGKDHQDHQAERDARRHRVQPQPDHIRRIIPGQKPHHHARGHQDGAEHDRHGSRDRQDDDETHPPGGSGFRAHRSTIASRLPARKPYGQL